jgi:hypothetical protein
MPPLDCCGEEFDLIPYWFHRSQLDEAQVAQWVKRASRSPSVRM